MGEHLEHKLATHRGGSIKGPRRIQRQQTDETVSRVLEWKLKQAKTMRVGQDRNAERQKDELAARTNERTNERIVATLFS